MLPQISYFVRIFLYKVIWHLLYDKGSASNIGTLYAAKNFLHATNVPEDPMDDVDATIDFLTEYTKALILAALHQVIETEKLDLRCLEINQEPFMNRILDLIVDNFALPTIYAEWKEEDIFKCKECGKSFKKVATLRKHRSNKHGPFIAPERYRPVIDQNQKELSVLLKEV